MINSDSDENSHFSFLNTLLVFVPQENSLCHCVSRKNMDPLEGDTLKYILTQYPENLKFLIFSRVKVCADLMKLAEFFVKYAKNINYFNLSELQIYMLLI